jgi:hypothetical protein
MAQARQRVDRALAMIKCEVSLSQVERMAQKATRMGEEAQDRAQKMPSVLGSLIGVKSLEQAIEI